MSSRWRSILVACAAVGMLCMAGVATAQYTVVAVMPDGSAVMRGPDGKVRSYQVPAGTTFNADGKTGVGVADLKPGMKVSGMESGIKSWSATDVMVHQELNAQVVAAAGNSLLIKGGKGVERYEWQNASDITIVKDGQVVDASSIHVGDRITGMIVQKAGPTSTAHMTMAKNEAAAEKPAAKPAAAPAAKAAEPAPAPAAKSEPAPAAAPAAEPAMKHHKKLPKTGTELPLFELAGALSMAAGYGVRRLRKA
jgi:LPXTG-motif cell wall-anchored protein